MPELQRLINQKPRDFLALAKAIKSGKDFNMEDAQGHSLFEILMDETFTSKNAQHKHFYEAWLNRFLCDYRSNLNLDDLLKKILNKKGIGKAINFDQILFLIRAGASPNITNEYNVPLLLFFTHYQGFRSADVEELVLRHGVAVDEPLAVVNEPSLDDKTCLRLFLDSEENPNQPPNWPVIMHLIGVGANVNTQNSNGDTALHLLVKKTLEPQHRLIKLFRSLPNYEAFIIKLSQSGADLTILNNQGQAIFSPLFNNFPTHLDSIMRLVRLGIHPDHIKDSQGKPLLHYLLDVKNGSFNPTFIAELASYHANFDISDAQGQTIEQILAKTNYETTRRKIVTIMKDCVYKDIPYSPIDCVNDLVEKHSSTQQDMPLLHYAVSNINPEHYPKDFFQGVLREIKRRTNINITNATGETALMVLLNQKPLKLRMIMALIALGADVNSKNKQGNTLLHLLVIEKITKRHDAATIDELIGQLAMRYKADFSVTNNHGKTPVQEVMDHPKSKTGDILNLVYLGANPNVCKTAGTPFLHYLTDEKNRNTLTRVVSNYQADINIKNQDGHTILDLEISSPSRHIERMHAYVQLGATFSKDSFQKLTAQDGLSDKDLRILHFEFADDNTVGCFLFKLMFGKPGQLASKQFYNLAKVYEDSIIDYVNTLSPEGKALAFFDILAERSALGILLLKTSSSPGFFARFNRTATHSPTYSKKFLDLLSTIPFYQNGELSNPELLVYVLSHCSLTNDLKDRVMRGFSSEGMKVFRNYLLMSNHTNEQIVRTLTSIKTHWHIHLKEEINDDYISAFWRYKQNMKPISLDSSGLIVNPETEASAPDRSLLSY